MRIHVMKTGCVGYNEESVECIFKVLFVSVFM